MKKEREPTFVVHPAFVALVESIDTRREVIEECETAIEEKEEELRKRFAAHFNETRAGKVERYPAYDGNAGGEPRAAESYAPVTDDDIVVGSWTCEPEEGSEGSPLGSCVFDKTTDPGYLDECLYCGMPEERK